ncbi:MAG: hypothetical protein LUF04_04400 [Bacteroides sp.]|nr:hypothetical protein [Bacteroides sp.]
MKDFVRDLYRMGAGQLLLLDSYQDQVAVLHMKGNGEELKYTRVSLRATT